MKILKQILCLLLVVVLTAALASCGGRKDTPSSSGETSKATGTAGTEDTTSPSEEGITQQGEETTTAGVNKTAATTTTKKNVTTTTKKAATYQTPDQLLAGMPSKLKNTTINIFLWEDLKNTIYKKPIGEFEKKTGIKVQTTIANYMSYTTELASAVASGKSPDVVRIIDNNVSSVTSLQPITKSGYDFSGPEWDHELMHDFTFNGRIYATNVKDSPNRNLLMVFYNKKALNRAKLEDPFTLWKNNPKAWTWDKFWDMADKFLEAIGRRTGYYGATFGAEDIYPRCFGAGLWRYDPDVGKHVNLIKSPETVKRYEILIDKINKNLATPVNDNVSYTQGKILFNVSYSSCLEKNFHLGKFDTNAYGFVPIPTDSTHNAIFSYCAYGIPVGAKNAAAVPYFIRYAFAPETNDLANFYETADARLACESMIKRGNFFFANGYAYNIWQSMISGTSAQVKSVLDSYSGSIDDSCLINDATIASLPK